MWANNPAMAGLGLAIIFLFLFAGVIAGMKLQERNQAEICVQDMTANGLDRNAAVEVCAGEQQGD